MTARRSHRPTAARAPRPRPAPPQAPPRAPRSTTPLWLHATRLAVVVGGVGVFVGATGLARADHPSHGKRRSVPLEAPAAFVDAVKNASLDAARIPQAVGPSPAATSTS